MTHVATGALARLRGQVGRLVATDAAGRERAVVKLTTPELRSLLEDWALWAHRGQQPPVTGWRVWLIRAGRGFGKTRAGAEWVSAVARTMPKARIALVGATVDEVRKVMIEGPSGLIAVARDDELTCWHAATGELVYASGARAYVYSAEAPEKLRGPEHHAAWCDELAKWRYGDAAWDNLMLGLRGGDDPRCVVTTTPRPTGLMRRVMAGRDTVETHGRTQDNPHLAAGVVAALEDVYGGTRLGRQELDGELIEDVDGALWPRWLLARCRVDVTPPLVRVRADTQGLPGRATGGPVSPMRPYVVGERGPELFVPTASGRIEAGGGGGARQVNIAIRVQADAGAAPAALARSSRQVARAVRAALEE